MFLTSEGGANAGQEGEDTKDGLGLGGEEEERAVPDYYKI